MTGTAYSAPERMCLASPYHHRLFPYHDGSRRSDSAVRAVTCPAHDACGRVLPQSVLPRRFQVCASGRLQTSQVPLHRNVPSHGTCMSSCPGRLKILPVLFSLSFYSLPHQFTCNYMSLTI